MGYKKLLEDINDLCEKYTVISGVIDIKDGSVISDVKNSYWIRMGNQGGNGLIEEAIKDFDVQFADVDIPGEYYFEAILTYSPAEYDVHGCTMRDYFNVEYIKFELQQTFEERERESKLNELFENNYDSLFNL